MIEVSKIIENPAVVEDATSTLEYYIFS